MTIRDVPGLAGRRGAWVVLVLALAVRWSAAFAGVLERPVDVDFEDRYEPIAESLLAGRGFELRGEPTAQSGPVYPLLIAAVGAVAGPGHTPVRAVVATLDGIQCALLFLLALRLFGAPGAWLAGVGAVACRPLVSAAWAATSHSVAVFLQTGFLLALVGALQDADSLRRWAAAGVLLALTALTRAEALALPVFLAPAVLLVGRGDRRTTLRGVAVLAVAFALTLAPWTVRNHVRLGGLVPVQSIGGANLLIGSTAERADTVPAESEAARDRRALRLAVSEMLARPGANLRRMGQRLARLFWPERHPGRAWVNPFHLVLVLAAAVGAFVDRGRWRRWLPVAMVVPCYGAVFTVVNVIYRYLLIVYPVLILFAGVTAAFLAGHLLPDRMKARWDAGSRA